MENNFSLRLLGSLEQKKPNVLKMKKKLVQELEYKCLWLVDVWTNTKDVYNISYVDSPTSIRIPFVSNNTKYFFMINKMSYLLEKELFRTDRKPSHQYWAGAITYLLWKYMTFNMWHLTQIMSLGRSYWVLWNPKEKL